MRDVGAASLGVTLPATIGPDAAFRFVQYPKCSCADACPEATSAEILSSKLLDLDIARSLRLELNLQDEEQVAKRFPK